MFHSRIKRMFLILHSKMRIIYGGMFLGKVTSLLFLAIFVCFVLLISRSIL